MYLYGAPKVCSFKVDILSREAALQYFSSIATVQANQQQELGDAGFKAFSRISQRDADTIQGKDLAL